MYMKVILLILFFLIAFYIFALINLRIAYRKLL